jgi:capsular polysaccharide biosynthesis protein
MMTIREQLLAIRSSRVIAGFHGAALALMVFASEDTSIIEITSPRFWMRNNYAKIAANTNATYSAVVVPDTRLGNDFSEHYVVPVYDVMMAIEMHIPSAHVP